MKKTSGQSQYHRSQISRAQDYVRENFHRNLKLEAIAKEAGSSAFHFARVFSAYTGQTLFDYVRCLRVKKASEQLMITEKSVTEIALLVGYETPSSLNKAFQAVLACSPSQFRNLGKVEMEKILQSLSRPSGKSSRKKETKMTLNKKFEIIVRPESYYMYMEKHGPFHEIAPALWQKFFPFLAKIPAYKIMDYMGMGTIDKTKSGDESMIYQAGVSMIDPLQSPLEGLRSKTIPSGAYARFLIQGSYSELWTAVDEIFKTLHEAGIELRPEFCIENYLNDPNVTPEADLRTEILVPVESA